MGLKGEWGRSRHCTATWRAPCLKSCVIYLVGSCVWVCVCTCVCVRCFCCCCFLFTRAALFIMAKLLFLLFYWCALESSWRGVKPGWGPGRALDAVNTTAMHIHEPADGSTYIYIYGLGIYIHAYIVRAFIILLGLLAFRATICRHNKLPIIFSFHISVIDFSSSVRANLPPPLPLSCDSWSTGRRPQSASN